MIVGRERERRPGRSEIEGQRNSEEDGQVLEASSFHSFQDCSVHREAAGEWPLRNVPTKHRRRMKAPSHRWMESGPEARLVPIVELARTLCIARHYLWTV